MEYFCIIVVVGLLAIIGGTLLLVRIISNAFAEAQSAKTTPPRAEPDPRQGQEILQLRNHIGRLEQRVSSLEANLDLLRMRAKDAPPAAPAATPSADLHFLDEIEAKLAPASTPGPAASPAAKPAPAPTTVPTQPTNVPVPPVKTTPPPAAPAIHPAAAIPAPAPTPTPGPHTPHTSQVPQTSAQSVPPQPVKAAPVTPPPAPASSMTQAPVPITAAKPAPVPVTPQPSQMPPPQPVKPATLPAPPVQPAKPIPPPAAPEPKRPPVTLEGLLTTRLFVWIAGIVLSLAGILLMKYLNDKSVFPEWSRLVLGAVIGFASIGAGQYFRVEYRRIAATLVGAGLTTLFAVVLAGTLTNTFITQPYIPKPVAFGLLAAIALGAVGLSLRHGMLVAVLGLLGGYVTPALLSTGEPKPVALALYLMFLQTGLVLVIRKRGWMPLAALTLLATMVWAGAMVFLGQIGAQGLPIALLLISTGVQFSLVLDRGTPSESAPESGADPSHWVYRAMGLVAVAAGLFLLSTRVALGDFQVTDWGYLGLVSLALILLGRLKEGYSLLPYFGLAATSFLFFQWMRQPVLAATAPSSPEAAPAFILASLTGVFVLGGMLAAIKGPHPARFAGLSAIGAAVFAGIGYWFQDKLGLHGMMPWVAVAGTGVFAIAAGFTHALVPPSRNKTLVSATYLVAASAFALAIAPLWFENWIAPAWAAQVLIMTLVARHFKIPILHGLALPIALLVFARLTLSPDLLTKDHAELGLIVWILSNYLPVSLFLAGAAWTIASDSQTPGVLQSDEDPDLLYHRHDGWLYLEANLLASLAQFLLGVMFTFLVRAAFVPESGNLWASVRPTATQWALWTSIWLGMCFVATLLSTYIAWVKNNWLPVLWMLASTLGCFLLAVFLNPVVPFNSSMNVGATPVLNLLLVLYGLPCLTAGACAWGLYKHGHKGLHYIAVTLAAGMGLLLLMLEIRHGFVGTPLYGPSVTLMQAGAFTLAGLLAAIGVRQAGRILGWEASTPVTACYLAFTGILFPAFQGMACNPVFNPTDLSTTIFFNPILFAYGLPALLLLAAADLLAPFTTLLRMAGAVLLALAAALLIRHGFHPEKFNELKFLLTEAGTYTIAGLVLAAALRQLAQRFGWPRFDAVTWVYMTAIGLGVILLQGLACNPVMSDGQVSTRIFFNAILYAYGLPSLLAIAGAQFMAPMQRFVRNAGVTGLFVTAILMVRHAFHPGNMTEASVMMVEAAAYTVTVKVLGVLAMEWAIRKKDSDTEAIAQAFLYVSLAMAVLGQILFKNPLVSRESVGTIPIFNGLLVLYLLPTALIAVQAWQCVRRDLLGRAKFNAVCAMVMAVLFLSFEARWFFHDGGVLTLFQNGTLQLGFIESSTYAPLWLLLGAGITWLGLKKAKPALIEGGFGLQAFAVGWVVFALLMLFNPIFGKNPVGAMVLINGITAGFLLPAAILIACSTLYQRAKCITLANISAWTGHALLFIGYSLTIRHFFQGEFLSAPGMGVTERYAYSAGWVLLALAFLVVGIFTGKHRPRYASLAIMIIGVIKVGYDIFLLQDLLRIISLAGLGVGLLLVTFMYQKYVFKAQEEEEDVA